MSEILDATKLAPLFVAIQPASTLGLGANRQDLFTVFYNSRAHYEACHLNDGMTFSDRLDKKLPIPYAWTDKRLTRAYKRYTLNCAVRRLEWL